MRASLNFKTQLRGGYIFFMQQSNPRTIFSKLIQTKVWQFEIIIVHEFLPQTRKAVESKRDLEASASQPAAHLRAASDHNTKSVSQNKLTWCLGMTFQDVVANHTRLINCRSSVALDR